MFGFFKKIGKLGAGGLNLIRHIPGVNTVALVIPGGSAALAAIGAADHVLDAVNDKGNPAKRAAGIKAVKATQALAKAGNVGAANGMTMLGKRAAALRAAREHRVDPRTGMVRRLPGKVAPPAHVKRA
jgi:hypothetical protein